MALSCIISEMKRDIGRKSLLFLYPSHSTPPLACVRSPSKTRSNVILFGMVWLPDGSGVGRILVWGGRGGEAPKATRGVGLFDLEMAHFDAHLRYSDVLILKFCFAM